MRWVSLLVPVHLFPLSSTYTFVLSGPLVMSSFFCLSRARAHMHLRPDLNIFGPPSGGRVCVCPLKSLGSTRIVLIDFLFFSRGQSHIAADCPTKRAASVADIRKGRLVDVPAWLWRLQAFIPLFR